MADKTIGSLTPAKQIDDESKLPIEQQGKSMYATGAQFREYAEKSVEPYATEAKKSAEEAKEYSETPAIIKNGTWWIWNAQTKDYVDTLLPSRGEKGEQGYDGVGVQSITLIKGNHAAGTFDKYKISYTDGSSYDFVVYNGADGIGAGDMTKIVYDPQGKARDIFKYTDDAINTTVGEINKILDYINGTT